MPAHAYASQDSNAALNFCCDSLIRPVVLRMSLTLKTSTLRSDSRLKLVNIFASRMQCNLSQGRPTARTFRTRHLRSSQRVRPNRLGTDLVPDTALHTCSCTYLICYYCHMFPNSMPSSVAPHAWAPSVSRTICQRQRPTGSQR